MGGRSVRSRLSEVVWVLVHRSGLLALGLRLRRLLGGGGTRVLCYHRVAPDPRPNDLSPEAFRAHLRHLARHYRFLDPAELVRAVREGREPPRDGIVLTFDDGYRDLLDHAVPALREAGAPAAVFVLTAGLPDGGRFPLDDPDAAPPLLSASDLGALPSAGVAVGSHTRTHASLPDLAHAEAREEIAGSREDLERATGTAPALLAYPWGRPGDRGADLCREAGYEGAFTTGGGPVRGGADPFLLPRLHLPGRCSPSRLACEAAGLVAALRGRR